MSLPPWEFLPDRYEKPDSYGTTLMYGHYTQTVSPTPLFALLGEVQHHGKRYPLKDGGRAIWDV